MKLIALILAFFAFTSFATDQLGQRRKVAGRVPVGQAVKPAGAGWLVIELIPIGGGQKPRSGRPCRGDVHGGGGPGAGNGNT